MMGTSHALSGAAVWLTGCAAATGLGMHPAADVVILGTAVCAYSALLPDMDHQGSRSARSLGLLTMGLSHLVGILSRIAYERTKTALDRPNRSGHRGLTHTVLAAVVLGCLVSAGMMIGPVPDLWWTGLAVLVGCLVHDCGDGCTHYGVPLFWPVLIRGQRWYCVGTPRVLRFRTGGPVEAVLVTPVLVLSAALAGLLVLTG